jgi:hypothetical protein
MPPNNAIDLAHILGVSNPHVAILAVLTCRADSRDARIASCAIAALVAHHYRVTPP